jgi:hypothetical protein
MVGLIVFLVLGFVFFLGTEIALISTTGLPPKDKDVLEFLEKVRKSNPELTDGAKPESMIWSSGNPYISTSLKSCLIGCYINDVGGIPRWYKSYGEIQKLYIELGAKGGKTKREMLGL